MVLIAVVGVSAVAGADSKADVQKLLRAHLAATVATQGALYDTVTDNPVLEDASGSYMSLFSECQVDRKTSSACAIGVPLFGTSWSGPLKYSAIKPVIHVDEAAHVATFYVTATLTGSLDTEGMSVKGKTRMRISGVATVEQGRWRIAAAKYSASVPDAALLAHGEVLVGNIFKPEPGLQQEVASWFGHLADHIAASPLGANGTAPAEVATTRPAMLKLATAWDKLALEPLTFSVHTYGDTAFVDMTVKWTTAKTALTFDMALVLAKEAGAWTWTSINFGPILMTEYSFR